MSSPRLNVPYTVMWLFYVKICIYRVTDCVMINCILTACLRVSTKWGDDTLVLCSQVVKVCAKVANIAELRIVEEEEPSTNDSLQRRKV